jgi:aminoglycoside phosphotransferase (APT) family kinase protein
MIVSSSDELTPKWFTQALGGQRSTVTDAQIDHVGGGAMCRMVRATLSWDTTDGGPESVIVKFPTSDEGTLGLARAMQMYELEVRFYRELLPHLDDLNTPICHFVELDEATGAFTLVLEDLSGRSRPGDVLAESTNDECSAVLAQLAHLQGSSWNSPTTASMPWLADRERTLQVFDSMPAGLEPFLTRFGHTLEPEQVTLFETVIPQAGKWIRSWDRPSVVQHGDLRTDNVLFSLDPIPQATIIDFQTVRLGPPGVDAAYFLGSSLSTETRRTTERALLAQFHERLSATGVAGYDFNACFRAYREGALYAVYLFCGLASQVASSDRVDRVIADQSRRYADMALDLEAPRLAGLV